MRVRFILHEVGRSGGAQTVVSYLHALADRGIEVEASITGPDPERGPGDLDVPVRAVGDGPECDVAVATFWPTAAFLWDVPARSRAMLLQSVESRFYEEQHFFERVAAEEALWLPVDYVVVAGWMRDLLAELRPDARCDVVRVGIDKEVFAPRERERHDGPLRVLVEGQPTMWFKGVGEALAATRAMSEPAEVTVVAGQPEDAGELGDGVRLTGGLDARGMADLYAANDVVVKLSRVESLGLGPLEAFHVGVPAVVTPYSGHEEYLVHGRNGLVVDHDDVAGAARALDRLARDRDLLGRLGEGALATAAEWPSAADSAGELAAALRSIAERPEPDAAAAFSAFARQRRRWTLLAREHVRQVEAERSRIAGEAAWYEHALGDARDHIDELNAARREVESLLAAADRRVDEIRSERAYRAAVAARRLLMRRGA